VKADLTVLGSSLIGALAFLGFLALVTSCTVRVSHEKTERIKAACVGDLSRDVARSSICTQAINDVGKGDN
jgi:hypothetical protein